MQNQTISDPRYKTIYQDANTIIERFCDILRNDQRFKNATIRRTGSIESGVKVGLPNESDHLLELEDLDAFDNEHITVTPCEDNKVDAMKEFNAMLSESESPSNATLFQRSLWKTKFDLSRPRMMSLIYRIQETTSDTCDCEPFIADQEEGAFDNEYWFGELSDGTPYT